MITYESFEMGKFLIIKYSGDIDKNYMMSFLKFSFLMPNKHLLTKILIDFRDANLNFTEEDFEDLKKARLRIPEGNKSLRTVYLVHDINETVYTTLFANDIPKNFTSIYICSTLDYCLKYLNLTMSNQALEERIMNLSFQFQV